MKVRLSSINVNGLAKGAKVKKLGGWVKEKKIHCVMIQEMTRGDGGVAANIENGHWRNGQWVIEGMVGIWIDEHWGRIVRKGGWDDRVCWAVCYVDGVGEFGVGNIYVPSDSEERMRWLPKLGEWCESEEAKDWMAADVLGGDFNMISRGKDDRSDQGNAVGWRAQERGLNLWKDIALRGGWIDFIGSDGWQNKETFTRWNERNGVRMASRIDWILGKVDWVHSGRLVAGWTEFLQMSDHEAVIIEMKMGEGIEWGTPTWKGHGGMFQEGDRTTCFRKEVERWLEHHQAAGWNEIKMWCLSWWEQAERLRRNSRNREMRKARRWLEEARVAIVARGILGPEEELVERTSWIMKWIAELERRKAERDKWKSRLWWDIHGEAMSTGFSRLLKGRRRMIEWSGLIMEDGVRITEKDAVVRGVGNFWRTTMDGYWCSDRGRKEWEEILPQKERAAEWMQNWNIGGDVEFWRSWMGEVTKEDVLWALKKGGRRKAPGLDGLPWEFWRTFNDIFVERIVEWCNGVLQNGSWGEGSETGLLALLYKKGDREDVRNWRPLQMLGTDRKILMSILARRLQVKLEGWIGREQRGFVKGRSIKESTAWVQAVIEGARVEKQRGRLIFLDQEKAYDRVGWGYLMAVFEKLGMEEELQKKFFGILASMKCSVAVNGWRGEEFWVGRGTPQGDPLSPNLYILAIEPLVDALR